MLLPNSPSCTKPKCTQNDPLSLDTTCDSDTELISSKNTSTAKKRKRKHRSSGSPKDKSKKKPLKKNARKNGQTRGNHPTLVRR